MNDSINIANRSYTRSNFNKTGMRPTRRNMTPDPTQSRMRSLNKHIQQHNVTQILGETQIALDGRRGDLDVTVDEKKEISVNLTSLKKKLDETREYRDKREKEINWMKGEIEKLKMTENFMREEGAKDSNKLEQLAKSVDTQKIKIEEATGTKNSYLHVLERIKKDKISDKLKVNNLENILYKGSHELAHEENNARKAKQFKIQTKMVFDEIMKQSELEDKKRQEGLNAFEYNLISKEEIERKREERIKRTQDIAETAAAEIRDSNEKKWRELLMVHRFLGIFMKKKMDREMKQYESVERAFQKIKASTGIADAKEIVTKFVRREDTYSELLISIASYEKKIAELKKTNEALKAKVHAIKEQNVPLERQKVDKDNENSKIMDVFKELHARTETYKITKLKIEKVRDWSIKTLLRIDKAQQIPMSDYYQMYSKDKVVDAFLKVIDTVDNYVATADESDIHQVLEEIDTIKMEKVENKEFIAKNVRVKPPVGRPERYRSADSQTNSRANLSREASEAGDSTSRDEKSFENEEEDFDKYLDEQRHGIKNKVRDQMIRRKKMKEKEEEERAKGK